jgi:hypothetical protein
MVGQRLKDCCQVVSCNYFSEYVHCFVKRNGHGLVLHQVLIDADCPPCLQQTEGVSRCVSPVTKQYCRSHQEIYPLPISAVDLQSNFDH